MIPYGAFLNTLVNFVIVAFILFLVAKAYNRMRKIPDATTPRRVLSAKPRSHSRRPLPKAAPAIFVPAERCGIALARGSRRPAVRGGAIDTIGGWFPAVVQRHRVPHTTVSVPQFVAGPRHCSPGGQELQSGALSTGRAHTHPPEKVRTKPPPIPPQLQTDWNGFVQSNTAHDAGLPA